MSDKFDWYSPREQFTHYASESTQQKMAAESNQARKRYSENSENNRYPNLNHQDISNGSSHYYPGNQLGYNHSDDSGSYNYYGTNNQLSFLQSLNAQYEALPINSRRLFTVSILCASVVIGMNFGGVGYSERQRALESYHEAQLFRQNAMVKTTHGDESKLQDLKTVERQSSKGKSALRSTGITNNNQATVNGNKMSMQNNWPQLQMNLANNGMNTNQPRGIVIVNGQSYMQQQQQQQQGILTGQQTIQNPAGQKGQPLMPNQPTILSVQQNSQPLINQQSLPQQKLMSETVTTQQSEPQQLLLNQQESASQFTFNQQNASPELKEQTKYSNVQQSFPKLSDEKPIANEEPMTNELQDQSGGGYVTENGQIFQNTIDPNDTPQEAGAESKFDPMAGFMDGFEGFDMEPIGEIPFDTESSVNNVIDDEEEEETEQINSDHQEVESVGIIGKPKISDDGTLQLEELNHFKNNWDPWERSDVPVFLHIPKAGGSTIKDLMGTCHRFVMATEMGITDGHYDDPEIAIIYPGGGPVGQDRSPFVNVDTTTVEGILRAKEMGFADSGLADAVVTPFIFETNDLFTPTAKGRLFTVFRHPIERAISMFYYIQVADWEPTYDPELKDWTIAQYAKSSKIENNWLTRQLSNQYEGELTDDNIKIAMEVIRRKFMVGLMNQIEETMERFERFFRWTYHVNPPNQEACRQGLLEGGSNKNSSGKKKEKPKEGSEEWELLARQNQYDLQLYQYIEALFKEQEQFVADIPVGFRLEDATCCKCGPPTYPPEGFTCPLAIMN